MFFRSLALFIFTLFGSGPLFLERIDELQTRYLEVCAEPLEQCVAHAFLSIMQKSSHKTRAGVQIDPRLSRKDLVNYTGTTLY